MLSWSDAFLGAVFLAIAVSSANARDVRPCLVLHDIERRVECLEGRDEARPAESPAKQQDFGPSPSFDCAKAMSPIELAICGDSTLRQLDSEMGIAYSRALKSQNNSRTLVDNQRQWLSLRNAKCGWVDPMIISACLQPMTRTRIADLAAVAAIQSQPSPEKAEGNKSFEPDVTTKPTKPKEPSETNTRPALDEAAAGQPMIESPLLSQHQAARDALFNTLSASATDYTFKYVVIHLPAGVVPGKNFSIPVSHVRYESTVFFGFNESTLQPHAQPILRDLARAIRGDVGLRSLLVVGHTDSVGPGDYNVNLSRRRAFTVAQSLQAAGVNAKYMGIIPMGKEQPFTTNSTKEGRALNRRVEFFISDIPEATEKAVQLIPFNPCFRNDQDAAGTPPATGCDNTPKRIPIFGLDTKPRGEIALNPIERPKLPHPELERPSIKELENSN